MTLCSLLLIEQMDMKVCNLASKIKNSDLNRPMNN